MVKAKNMRCFIFLILWNSFLLAMDGTQEEHKLEGIFVTKAASLSEVNPTICQEGDVVFFGCDEEWTTYDKKSSRSSANPASVSFLAQCQKNGALCLHLDRKYLREENWYQGYGVLFSSPFETKKSLDNNTYILNGYIRSLGSSFWPHEKINLVIKHLKQTGKSLRRVLYFSNNIDILSDIIDKSLSLPSQIYYIVRDDNIFQSPATSQIWLADQPSAHWAFTLTKEEQINYIRKNPLVLGLSYQQPHNQTLTYNDILANSVLDKAFEQKQLSHPSPLIKTFLLSRKKPVTFAQWLAPIYDEAIWPDIIFYTERIVSSPISQHVSYELSNFIYESLFEQLIKAGTQRDTYARHMEILFQKVLVAHLRKSVLQSMALIALEHQEAAIKNALGEENRSELEVVFALAEWGAFSQPATSAGLLAQLFAQEKTASPFELVDSLKTNLPEGFSSTNFGNFITVLDRYYRLFKKEYKTLNEIVPQVSKALWHIALALKELNILKGKLSLSEQEEKLLFTILIKLSNKEPIDLSNLFSALTEMLQNIPKKHSGNYTFKEIPRLLSIEDLETRSACAIATNQIAKALPSSLEQIEDILKNIIALSSNQERQIVGILIPDFLNSKIFQRIPSEEYWIRESVLAILKIPSSHQAFFLEMVHKLPATFVFNTTLQIVELAREIHKVQPEQFEHLLEGFSSITEISHLRKSLGLKYY